MQPLQGLRIIEFDGLGPVTFAAMMLADLGAEVLRLTRSESAAPAVFDQVGGAVLLHRLLIHGVAPWAEGAVAPPEGRMVAYFRPVLPSVEDWLRLA